MSNKEIEVSADEVNGIAIGAEPEATEYLNGASETEPENNDSSEDENDHYITAGDRKCYIYFDEEFTGLKKDTDLISIGLVDCDGRSFYAEFNDYSMKKLTPWILENVIQNLEEPATVLDGDHWTMQGNKKEIRTQLFLWLDKYISEGTHIQFVSDVSHYDFVLLIDLLTGGADALSLPNWISPCCVDINQDIATSLYRAKPKNVSQEEFDRNYIPAFAAFDISREAYISGIPNVSIPGKKHNSLYDAMVIRAIHQNLWNIEK